jgi:quinoprotein glucose dehydrogenase
MPGEQSWPTQPVPSKPEAYVRHTFTVKDISPYLAPEEAEAFKKRLLPAANKGIFTPISYSDTVHVPTSNGGTLFGGTAAEPDTGAVYLIAHENPGIIRLIRPGRIGRGGGPRRAAQAARSTKRIAASRAGPPRTDIGVPLILAADSPANNIVAGTSRFDAATIRAAVITGKSRMPALPHITGADLENLVTYLTALPPGRGRGAGGFGRVKPRWFGAPPS